MKNTVNVSIAGIAFRLEEEAYERLGAYLEKLRKAYGNSPEGDEILGDIEARIAEIILTRQNASAVVPAALIAEILAQLGAPEEFSDNPAETPEVENTPPPKRSGKRIPHRLYRNPEGAKLGGVCSGLAAYFNIDPVPVRLLFAFPLILLVFFAIIQWGWFMPPITGLMVCTFILYFLLWIVIPKAKTPLQKMEMRGEKITRDSLEQTFREEFQSRSNDPRNIELRAKNERNASVFSEFVSIVGRILLFCAKAFVAVIGFSFVIAMIAILGTLAVILLYGPDIIHGLHAPAPGLFVVLIGLAVLIPLGLLVYAMLKFIFGFSNKKPFITTMLVIWVLTLVFGTAIFIRDFEHIRFDDGFRVNWKWGDKRIGWFREDFDPAYSTGKGYDSDRFQFNISGDSLFIVPMDSTQMPENFVVEIERSNRVDTTGGFGMKVSRHYKYRGKGRLKESKEYLKRITLEHAVRNDTLFLKPVLPSDPAMKGSRIEVEITLSAGQEAVVADGIRHEYDDN